MNLLVFCLALSIQQRPENLVLPVSGSPQIIIPAAGSVQGANGTFFKSDITLINFRNTDQSVELRWIPQAGTGTTTSVTRTIAASSGIRSDDFTRLFMNQTGLGAIVVTGMNGTVFDPSAVLYATSRVWTPQPGTDGTTSQSLNTLPASATIGSPNAAIFGVRRDAKFRVNVGIVNLDSTRPQSFVVSALGETYAVTVPALTMTQVPLNQSSGEISQVNITNTTPAESRSGNWVAYGSTIDNVTGDAWSELAIAGTP